MKEVIEKLVSKHTLNLAKAKTLEDYAETENNFTYNLLEVIKNTSCCKSDSEQLHTEVFKLANKLAINGYGNEAVIIHGICNGI